MGVRGFIIVVSGVAALGGLLFGYDTGIISTALLYITKDFQLGTQAKQIVTAALIAGALVGCVGAGPISDSLGRRRTVMVAAVIFIAGSFAAAWSPNAAILTGSRFVLGLAVGAATQIVPVYIAELAPARSRGALVVLFQLAIVSGVTVSYIIGYLLSGGGHWRIMMALGAVPALILGLGMIFLPESPRWLVVREREEEARATLKRVRESDDEIDAELDDIKATERATAGWGALRRPWLRPALIAGMGVGLFCQLTGVNAVIYYAPTILANAGFGDQAAILTSIGVGVVMIVITVFGTWAVDRWGRRSLVLRFLPGAVIALVILGATFLGGGPNGAVRWVAIAALLGYIVFNVGSLSTVIWLVGSEVFPLSVRGKGASLVAMSHWGGDLLITLTTLTLTQTLGTAGAFWLFAAINAVAWVFVRLSVPETKGKSLEAIEGDLRDGRFAPGL